MHRLTNALFLSFLYMISLVRAWENVQATSLRFSWVCRIGLSSWQTFLLVHSPARLRHATLLCYLTQAACGMSGPWTRQACIGFRFRLFLYPVARFDKIGYRQCGGSRCLWRELLCNAAAEGASQRSSKNPSAIPIPLFHPSPQIQAPKFAFQYPTPLRFRPPFHFCLPQWTKWLGYKL